MTTSPVDLLFNKPRFSTQPSTNRCLALLERLSIDPKKMNAIGITGSNGKGSTALMLGSVLSKHGFRTGVFTSPHFFSPTERFRVNNELISEDLLDCLAKEVMAESLRVENQLSQEFSRFELLTIIAFLYLKNENVDIAILEAGIGGRLDPTRLAGPKISAITSLELEHSDVLGDTLVKIFKEKLLLLESGGVCYPSLPEDAGLREACNEIALNNGVNLRLIENEFKSLKCYQSSGGTVLEIEGELIHIPLAGSWQGRNLALAIALARAILPISKFSLEIVRDAVRDISIPGRFEKIHSDPDIFIDSAHTVDALNAVVHNLKERIQNQALSPIILLGISKGKPVKEMLKTFIPLVKGCSFFVSCSTAGGIEPQLLKSFLEIEGAEVTLANENAKVATMDAISYARQNKKSVFVLGSIYFGSEVSRIIGEFQNGFSKTQ